MSRWAVANYSTYKFFETMGADVSRWVWTSPGEYSGSVFSSLAADIMGAPAIGSKYGETARKGLIEAPLDFIPMWAQMKNMAKAMNDPNPLVRMLGFTPVKPKPPFSEEYAVNLDRAEQDLEDLATQGIQGEPGVQVPEILQELPVTPGGPETLGPTEDEEFDAMRERYLARPQKPGTTEQTEVLPGVFRIGDMSWANMPDHKSYDLIVWDKATGQYVDTFFSTAADEDLVEKVRERRAAFGWDERPK
jgi:hypothetical protein